MGVLIFMLNIREKATYIRINSGGIFFVIVIIGFLICVGIRALVINTFTTNNEPIPDSNKKCKDDWNCLKHNNKVHISLFETNFFLLSGILTLSFFLHNCIAVIMKNNEKQENNNRDLALGYIAAGSSYLSIAVIGYFGFTGNGFPQSAITQNALDMFSSTNPLAFMIRIILFTQMFTVYPMIMYIMRMQFFGFIYGTDYPSKGHVFIMSLVTCSTTTLVSSIYPNVGTIVGIVGAFCGLYFVYILPVCIHIYYSKPVEDRESIGSSMKIALSEEEMIKTKKSRSMLSWKMDSALHCLIILFGLLVVLFQFFKA